MAKTIPLRRTLQRHLEHVVIPLKTGIHLGIGRAGDLIRSGHKKPVQRCGTRMEARPISIDREREGEHLPALDQPRGPNSLIRSNQVLGADLVVGSPPSPVIRPFGNIAPDDLTVLVDAVIRRGPRF
jgi:hypothetical protein